jgi:hypothetical protein
MKTLIKSILLVIILFGVTMLSSCFFGGGRHGHVEHHEEHGEHHEGHDRDEYH